jgi:hypothetical protein
VCFSRHFSFSPYLPLSPLSPPSSHPSPSSPIPTTIPRLTNTAPLTNSQSGNHERDCTTMTPSGSRPANNCNDPQYTNYKALFPMPVVEGADASALPTPASRHAALGDGASHGDFGSGATAGAGYARRRIRGVGAAPSSPSSPPPLLYWSKNVGFAHVISLNTGTAVYRIQHSTLQ